MTNKQKLIHKLSRQTADEMMELIKKDPDALGVVMAYIGFAETLCDLIHFLEVEDIITALGMINEHYSKNIEELKNAS